jgi:carbon storage regulator
MLVLARKQGESLRIGADVRITVVRLGSGQVKLAIEAPEELPVHREEVWERIAKANREAALASFGAAGEAHSPGLTAAGSEEGR